MKTAFLHPKFWPTWLGIGALRLFEPLPHGLLYLLGRGLGWLVFQFPTSFKRIARRNLELALPELVPAARERILREHFKGLGCALFETAMSWWSSCLAIVIACGKVAVSAPPRWLSDIRGALMAIT